jgi:hypothetical protein
MTPTEFYIAEAEHVHRLMDEAGIPRESFGERLSMSQRVELLVLELKSKEVS